MPRIIDSGCAYGIISDKELKTLSNLNIAYICNEPIESCPFAPTEGGDLDAKCTDVHLVHDFFDRYGGDYAKIAVSLSMVLGRDIEAKPILSVDNGGAYSENHLDGQDEENFDCNDNFMQEEITEKQKWYEVSGNNGTEFIPYDIVGDIDIPAGDEYLDALPESIASYCENTKGNIRLIEGYGARFSAPGYLDCTPWGVFQSIEDAEKSLRIEQMNSL